MDVHKLVTEHYGSVDLATTIVDALRACGVDTSALRAQDLSPIDHLHAGFASATAYVLEQLEVGTATRLLDVGCGIGGGCRMAAELGARVVGVDLTDEFIRSALTLSQLTGLADRITYLASSVAAVDLPDDSFEAAMMMHVGMNLPDKRDVFAEVRRLLGPGGRFAVFDQMRVGEGALTYPLPWAVDAESSFVVTPDAYVTDLEAAGFSVELRADRTRQSAGPPSGGVGGGPLSPAVIFGPDFVTRVHNNIADTTAGRLGAVLLVARAV